MKKIISIVCVLIVCLTSFPQKTKQVIAEDLPPLCNTGRECLEEMVDKYAEKYSVSAEQMKTVIACESGWDTDIQSQHINKQGEQEQSFGLVQIHLPSHPLVTYEQATDPEFSLDFMARAFSEGEQSMWTCYRTHYGKI